MKRTAVYLLCVLLLHALGLAQNIYPLPGSDLDFSRITNSTENRLKGASQRIVGTNLTDGACFPLDPAKAAADLKRKGYTAVELHHIDRILNDDWARYFPRFRAFISALNGQGIKHSLSLYTKGREHLEGNAQFKLNAYRDAGGARPYLEGFAKKLLLTPGPDGTRLVDDKNLWTICLINEGADLLRQAHGNAAADMARKFYQWGKSMLVGIGYKGLVGDIPDGAVDAALFGPVAAEQDICLFHTYGDDARDLWRSAYWLTSWAAQTWQWGTNEWFSDLSGKRTYVKEYGSLPYNPSRGANTFFAAGQIAFKGYDSASFAWASNEDSLAGRSYWLDFTNLSTDVPRVVADLLSIALARFDTRLNRVRKWPPFSADYDYQSDTALVCVRGSRAWAIVVTKGTLAYPARALVFTVGPTDAEGLETSPIDEWRRAVVRHGLAYSVGNYKGFEVEVPTKRVISDVWDIDPYTGERTVPLKPLGPQSFKPLSRVSVSVVEFAG